MAKKQYWAYTSALSSLSQAASTAMYGNEYEQATKSVGSAYYASLLGTWDDTQMRTWLEEHDIIKPKQKPKRDELFAKIDQYYLSATDPFGRRDRTVHSRVAHPTLLPRLSYP